MSLTDTQQAILALIAERIDAEGFPPSQTEIARAFGFKGVRAAQYHLEALEAAGAIERLPGRARGIRVLQPPPQAQRELGLVAAPAQTLDEDALRLPVLGRVAAGAPIGADAETEAHVLIDRTLFSPRPDYLLRVKGDSMREDGIFDGDLVAVHRTADARSGQVVVARLGDEVTIKRLLIDADGIALLPRNPDYAPIRVPADADFAIEGLYCGLVRSA